MFEFVTIDTASRPTRHSFTSQENHSNSNISNTLRKVRENSGFNARTQVHDVRRDGSLGDVHKGSVANVSTSESCCFVTYVVFERRSANFNHITFSCYHENNTQITRMTLVSLIYITRKSLQHERSNAHSNVTKKTQHTGTQRLEHARNDVPKDQSSFQSFRFFLFSIT